MCRLGPVLLNYSLSYVLDYGFIYLIKLLKGLEYLKGFCRLCFGFPEYKVVGRQLRNLKEVIL